MDKETINRALAYIAQQFTGLGNKIDSLSDTVKKSSGKVELDLTTRAIEKLQDSKALDANVIVDELKNATKLEVASKQFLAEKLSQFEKALDKNINGLANLSEHAGLLKDIKTAIVENGKQGVREKNADKTQGLLQRLIDITKAKEMRVEAPDMSGIDELSVKLDKLSSVMESKDDSKIGTKLDAIYDCIEKLNATMQNLKMPSEFKLDDMQLKSLRGGMGGGGVSVLGGAPATYSKIGVGNKTVTTAGTAVQVSSTSIRCSKLEITALETNAGVITVGDSNVVAAVATRKGTPLGPGDTLTMNIHDVSKIYIDSTVSADKISYTYYD